MDFNLSDSVYTFVSLSVDLIFLVVTMLCIVVAYCLRLCILSVKIISAKDPRRNLGHIFFRTNVSNLWSGDFQFDVYDAEYTRSELVNFLYVSFFIHAVTIIIIIIISIR